MFSSEELNNDAADATVKAPRRSRRVSAPQIDTADAAQAATTSESAENDALKNAEAKNTEAAEAETAAPKRRGRPPKKVVAEVEGAQGADAAEGTADKGAENGDAAGEAAEQSAPKRRGRPPRKTAEAKQAEADAADGESAAADAAGEGESDDKDAEAEGSKRRTRVRGRRAATAEAGEQEAAKDNAEQDAEAGEEAPEKSRRRSRARGADRAERGAEAKDAKDAEKSDKNEAEGAEDDADRAGKADQRQTTRTRTRSRDRRRRGDDEEITLTEEDVLVPVAGILDVLDNYAFVRTTGYHPGNTDVYVSLSQVKRHGLRKGDAVVGAVKQPREGDNSGRQKYNALMRVDSINGQTAEEAQNRVEFTALTAISPVEHVALAGADSSPNLRAIDVFAPVALGQRGLIVGDDDKLTDTLADIAQAFAKKSPGTHIMSLMVGARPEIVTEQSRKIDGEVIAASSDTLPEEQLALVELAIERAKRLVELGHDVALFIDNLSQLALAVENQMHRATKSASAGLIENHVVLTIKRLLSQARNLENGGSLAIYAGVRSVSDLIAELYPVQNWFVLLHDFDFGADTVSVNVFNSNSRLSVDSKQNPAIAAATSVKQAITRKVMLDDEDITGESLLREALGAARDDASLAAEFAKLEKLWK